MVGSDGGRTWVFLYPIRTCQCLLHYPTGKGGSINFNSVGACSNHPLTRSNMCCYML